MPDLIMLKINVSLTSSESESSVRIRLSESYLSKYKYVRYNTEKSFRPGYVRIVYSLLTCLQLLGFTNRPKSQFLNKF